MNTIDYHPLLKLAIESALMAADKIIEIYNTDFTYTSKEDHSPVTKADKLANEIICEKLSPTGIHILSEEGIQSPWQERKTFQYLWIVDPLDGTKEFIKKNDEFTVNIALTEFGTPVMGVIYCPVLRVLYYGSPSVNGAFKVLIPDNFECSENSLETLFSIANKLPFEMITEFHTVVVSRSHSNEDTEKYISNLKKEHSSIRFVSRGSSLKLCMIAEGAADIYPRFGPTCEWDIAAGDAIIRLSGGEVYQQVTNEPLKYNKEDILNPWFIAVKSNYKI